MSYYYYPLSARLKPTIGFRIAFYIGIMKVGSYWSGQIVQCRTAVRASPHDFSKHDFISSFYGLVYHRTFASQSRYERHLP